MFRVLQVTPSMDRGGIETLIMNIFRNIDRSKVVFDFLTYQDKKFDYSDEIIKLGGRIYSVPSFSDNPLRNYKALNDFFSKHKEYSVIHAHMTALTNVNPLIIAKRHGVPTRIVHSHNTRIDGLWKNALHFWNQKRISSYATDFFACSNLAANWMFGKKANSKKKCLLIKNGVEVDKFAFNENIRTQLRKELGIENKLVLGNVARFSLQKNHTFLLDIFKSVHDASKDSVLMLVGAGELEPVLKDKISRLQLTDSVIFTGVRSDVNNILQAMDVFVFPSLFEGLPVTLIEAQASGIKIFASDVITDEVCLTDSISLLPLSQSAQYWADQILGYKSKEYRADKSFQITSNGYDILETAKILEDFYLN